MFSPMTNLERIVLLVAKIELARDGAEPLARVQALKAELQEAVDDMGPVGVDRRTDALIKIRQVAQLVHENVYAKVRRMDTIAWEGLR